MTSVLAVIRLWPCGSINIETGTTTTAARCSGITDNLELAANQLAREVYRAAFQEFQARLIHYHLCFFTFVVIFKFEYGVILVIYLIRRL